MSPDTNRPRSRSTLKTCPWGHPAHRPGSRAGTSMAPGSTEPGRGRPSDARSTSGENSPMAGKVSLPWQVSPQARTCVSITGSSSSTT